MLVTRIHVFRASKVTRDCKKAVRQSACFTLLAVSALAGKEKAQGTDTLGFSVKATDGQSRLCSEPILSGKYYPQNLALKS
jgi:hypothetical protein